MADGGIHPSAVCEAVSLGVGAVVGAFAFVDHDSSIGERADIGAGARVLGGTSIGTDARIGENSVVLGGVTVGRGAVVEPGSVVADSVPANAIVRGNPARIIGYRGVEATAPTLAQVPLSPADRALTSRVRGVRLHRLTRIDDLRGRLIAAELDDLPFVPARLFTVSNVPSEHIRGSHAHLLCEQFLICVSGGLTVVVDDAHQRDEFRLDDPDFGLYLPPMTWSTQYRYSHHATLLVLASRAYEPGDYVRDYDEFVRIAGGEVHG